MSSLLKYCEKGLITFTGLYRAADAAYDIREAITDPRLTTTQKAHRTATDVLVIGAQGLSAWAPFQTWSSDTRLAINGALGVADTARQVSYMYCKTTLTKGDLVDFGSNVSFRIANFLENLVELKPEPLGTYVPHVRYSAQILYLFYAGVQFTGNVLLPFIRYMREKPQPVEMTLLLHEDKDPELIMDESWLQNINQILQAPNIDAFQKIPDLFREDPVFTQFRCPLSDNRPIRYVRVVKGTENTATPIYYERQAILNSLKATPRQTPSNWPAHVPFEEENIIDVPFYQTLIDQRLQKLMSDLKPLKIETKPLPLAVSLAQELQLGNTEYEDADIADALLKKNDKIGNISVNTIMHRFSTGEKPKLSRKICVIPMAFKKSASFTEQTMRQAFQAFLGSQEKADREILSQALTAYRKMETYISIDLQSAQFKWS